MSSVTNISQQSLNSINPSSGNVDSRIQSVLSSITNSFHIAVVVDVILNDSHPFFGDNYFGKKPPLINSQMYPVNYKGGVPDPIEKDYSFIGRIKIRILDKEVKTPIDKLPWAIPLDNTITQYPLINEQVLVVKIGSTYYYTKPVSQFNYLGINADYSTEAGSSANTIPAEPMIPTEYRQSYTAHPIFKNQNKVGYLGEYFILNPFIRTLKKSEGDTSIESRFGQSIRFTAYTDVRADDKSSYPSYSLNPSIFNLSKNGGYGNPRIVIRNRQRNIALDKPQQLHPKLPPIPIITPKERNYSGQIEEDINNDGSTIEINSGGIVSKWKTTVYKSMFGITGGGDPTEEQTQYNPPGSTDFVFPILNNDQIVINTDRLVFSSRFSETVHFSKKRYGIVTDAEYTVDANNQIVLTTNKLTCLNSPQIFLGQYAETNEPAMLGQTTVDWLYDLCNWLLDHVHWYHHVHPYPHSHPDAGREYPSNTQDSVPDQTQIPVQQITLKLLRDNLHKTLSRRVFLTGGGYAPGANGVKPPGSGAECGEPTNINVVTGAGVVGDFKGRNRREGPVQIEFQFN